MVNLRDWVGAEACRHLIMPSAEVEKYVQEHRVGHSQNLAVGGSLLGEVVLSAARRVRRQNNLQKQALETWNHYVCSRL